MEKMNFSDEAYSGMISSLFKRFPSFQSSGQAAYKPGLDRMEFFDQLLGHPHRSYRCIHVAGTNGKGSVSNMLASALSARGLKVGLYTSPHLLDFRERARIKDGDAPVRLIPREAVWDFVQNWRETMDHLGLSFFEVTTMMALDWFSHEGIDVAVIETGLGGRLDSTNIITPVLSVITNIGYDHCDLLGSTLGEIAFEKAGIIKPLVPAVIGESNPETDCVFERKVLYTNLPEPSFAGDREKIMALLTFADRQPRLAGEDGIIPSMDLQGPCQRHNLRTVLCALGRLELTGGHPCDDVTAISATARRMEFHGRWERLSACPEVICDIGHNAHGLKDNFARLEAEAASGRSLTIVYGSVADKDVDSVLSLLPRDAGIIFTSAANHRAMPAGELAARYAALKGDSASPQVYVRPSVADAVALALSLAEEDSSCRNAKTALPLVYVGGSTYVVAEAVPLFA